MSFCELTATATILTFAGNESEELLTVTGGGPSLFSDVETQVSEEGIEDGKLTLKIKVTRTSDSTEFATSCISFTFMQSVSELSGSFSKVRIVFQGILAEQEIEVAVKTKTVPPLNQIPLPSHPASAL
ncbi:MAG: hypothetical protein AAF558_07680 [Verrucomicrobiota bacterium]